MAITPEDEFDDDTRFVLNLDPSLWSGGSVAIPNVFLDEWMVRLNGPEFRALMQLCRFAEHLVDGDPTVRVSAEELYAGFRRDTDPMSVITALDTLEAYGLLIRDADNWQLNVQADWNAVPEREFEDE